jgi:SH3-like domain-containing protein
MRTIGRVAIIGITLLAAAEAVAQVRPMARPDGLVLPDALPMPDEGDVVTVAAQAPASLPARVSGDPNVGPVTSLPLPRYVSLKTDEGNARRGPSLDHRVDWVFVREDMPLRITAEYENWRRVEDREGQGGWVHYTLLSGTRTVIVDQDRLELRTRPDDAATAVALVEAGAVARLDSCGAEWCRIIAGGYRGWVPKAAIWGVGADEIID